MVSAPPTAQNNIAGIFSVDVRRGQVDGAAARMGHLCLRPIKSDGDRRSKQNMVLVHDEKRQEEKKKNQRQTGNNEEKREKRKLINEFVKSFIQIYTVCQGRKEPHKA